MATLRRHRHAGPVQQGLAETNAAFRQRQQAGDRFEQRGLATATRSEQADDLVVGHRQGELFQHVLAVITAAYLLYLQARHDSVPLVLNSAQPLATKLRQTISLSATVRESCSSTFWPL
ncbi:hypothetical protein D3C80_1606270 [compost metagenome]